MRDPANAGQNRPPRAPFESPRESGTPPTIAERVPRIGGGRFEGAKLLREAV